MLTCRRTLSPLLAATLPILLACGGSEAPDRRLANRAVTTASDFAIAVSPAFQQLFTGSSAAYQVSTSVVAGSSLPISLSISRLPAGVTAAFSPATVQSGQAATLTLTATACLANMAVPFTVTGTAPKARHSAAAQAQIVRAPIATVATPAANAIVSGPVTIDASATGCNSIARVELWLDGALFVSGTGAHVIASWDTTGASDGQHTIVARAVDSAGAVSPDRTVPVQVQNSSATRDFSLSLSPSAATIPTGGAPAVYSLTSSTTVGRPQQLQLALGGLPAGVTATLGSSSILSGDPTQITVVASAAAPAWDGSLVVSATGVYATRSASASLTVADATPPVAAITTPQAGATLFGLVTFSATRTDNTPASPGQLPTALELALDGSLLGQTADDALSVMVDTRLFADGAHTLTATAHDVAGNVGVARIDLVVQNSPSIASLFPSEGQAGDAIQVFGSRLDSVVSASIGGAAAQFTVASASSLTVTIPAGAAIGNEQLVLSSATGSVQWPFVVHGTTPWVTAIGPAAAGPGAQVTVSGRNFPDVVAVELGGRRAYFYNWGGGNSFSFVQIFVPDGAASGPVHIVSAANGAGDSGAFTLLPPLGMSPATGLPGTEVLLEGPGIGSATAVQFSDQTAAFQVIDATHVKTWVPAHAASTHIVVTTPSASPSTPVFVVPRSGTERTLVMRLQPTDRTQDCTNDQLQSQFFGPVNSADALYASASGGRTRVAGDVIGPLLIPFSSTGCTSLDGWFAAADDLARQAGYDPSTYAHRAYFFPSGSCGVSTVSTVPGLISAPAAFCPPGSEVESIHEFGHSLGLNHASTPTSEYGDLSDVMGGQQYVGPNAPHRIQLGWLADSAWRSAGSGPVTLAPLDATSPLLQVVWLPGRTNDFFVSYVRRIDVSSQNLPDAYADHVLVHTVSHEPVRGGLYAHTILRAALLDGGSYVSPEEGVRIDAVAHDAAGAQVMLSSGPATCFRDFPTFTAGPVQQTGTPGTPLVYTYSLVNNDAGDCPTSIFQFGASANYGPPDARWQITYDRQVVTVPPGQAAIAQVTVTSPVTAAAQDFFFFPVVSDSANPSDHPFLQLSALHYQVVAP